MSYLQAIEETQEGPHMFFDFTVYRDQITQDLYKRVVKPIEKELRTQDDTLESN